MDTCSLPQKFPFILDRNLAKANWTGNRLCTSCGIVGVVFYKFLNTTKSKSWVYVRYIIYILYVSRMMCYFDDYICVTIVHNLCNELFRDKLCVRI